MHPEKSGQDLQRSGGNIHATPFEWFSWETEILFSSWKSEYNLVKVN